MNPQYPKPVIDPADFSRLAAAVPAPELDTVLRHSRRLAVARSRRQHRLVTGLAAACLLALPFGYGILDRSLAQGRLLRETSQLVNQLWSGSQSPDAATLAWDPWLAGSAD